MTKLLGFVLLLLGLAYGSQLSSKFQQDSSKNIHERMESLERYLMRQEDKDMQRDELLDVQKENVARQDFLLRQQGDIIRQQESKLWRQDNLLTYQNSVLRQQDELLRDQGKMLARLDASLRQQEGVLRHQEGLLRHQKGLLHQLELKLSSQNKLLSQWKPFLPSPHHDFVDNDSGNTNSNNYVTRVSENKNMNVNNTDDMLGALETVKVSSRDVLARSDDQGPLEIVVDQLTQKVTQIDAEVQAFKTQTSADIQSLKNTNAQQDLDIDNAQSSTYTQWGSSQCSGSSELLYSGIVGGSKEGESGGSPNYLCLTLSPVPSNHRVPGPKAYLYGAEYYTGDSNQNRDPVCAVCRASFSTTVMIPGTNLCTDGWHALYTGFLMSGHFTLASGFDYICVDSKLESRLSAEDDKLAAQLAFTDTQCGSLPCQPYVNNTIVTCVVCGK